jgi:hypothetical protein
MTEELKMQTAEQFMENALSESYGIEHVAQYKKDKNFLRTIFGVMVKMKFETGEIASFDFFNALCNKLKVARGFEYRKWNYERDIKGVINAKNRAENLVPGARYLKKNNNAVSSLEVMDALDVSDNSNSNSNSSSNKIEIEPKIEIEIEPKIVKVEETNSDNGTSNGNGPIIETNNGTEQGQCNRLGNGQGISKETGQGTGNSQSKEQGKDNNSDNGTNESIKQNARDIILTETVKEFISTNQEMFERCFSLSLTEPNANTFLFNGVPLAEVYYEEAMKCLFQKLPNYDKQTIVDVFYEYFCKHVQVQVYAEAKENVCQNENIVPSEEMNSSQSLVTSAEDNKNPPSPLSGESMGVSSLNAGVLKDPIEEIMKDCCPDLDYKKLLADDDDGEEEMFKRLRKNKTQI